MKIEIMGSALNECKARCLVILATSDGKSLNGSKEAEAVLEPFVKSGEFGESFGGSMYVTDPKGLAAERVLFYNLGKEVKKANDLRKATARSWKGLRDKGFKTVAMSLNGLDEAQARAAYEGIAFGNYAYTEFKTEDDSKPKKLESLTLLAADEMKDKIASWEAQARGTNHARDLCQMPPNILNPIKFADIAVEWGKEYGLKTTILNREEIEEEGMGTMMAVAQGSAAQPRFIIMDYTPDTTPKKTICLVGKAVTFDSGGLNIKTSMMHEMKGDMGGGATVAGIMTALRDVKCPHRVIALIPSVENMPSAMATRPSDVVKSLSGITVEINNTDAEGRLIMADALTYAGRYKPDFVMDFATLTGACVVALGPKVFGVMGNHQPLIDAIVKTSWELHEPFWQLPLFDDYKELLKSSTADISNMSSSRYGGAIAAGLFLERFARDYQWVHCDIAAGIFDKADDYNPVGGVGAGVRTIIEVLENL